VDTIFYNVVVLPSPEIKELTISWSKLLGNKFSTAFVLDGTNYHPHLSLYQAVYPAINRIKIIQKLENIVQQTKPFVVTFKKLSELAGFIFYDAVKNLPLVTLHNTVLNQLNPLRENILNAEQNALLQNPSISKHLKVNMENYGYLLALDAYAPHVTLTRLKNTAESDLALQVVPHKQVAFTVDRLFLTSVGHDGTVTEIFKEFLFCA